VLTKPLGTGIVNTALKRERASQEAVDQVVASMSTLNARAAEVMSRFEVHACTDVTGFGLLGHALEMVEDSEVGFEVMSAEVPLFRDTLRYAEEGLKPGGLKRNRDYRFALVERAPGVSGPMMDALHDPQTSGGLLLALAEADAPGLLRAMQDAGVVGVAQVGRAVAGSPGRISVV